MGGDRLALVGDDRFRVYLVNLDPTVGSAIRKARPCVVISPDEMNRHLRTIIVAPMTSAHRDNPSRIAVRFGGRDGDVALEQIRTVDRQRAIKPLGRLGPDDARQVCARLQQLFAY